MSAPDPDLIHPFLPSGEWSGFYLYGEGAASPRHDMDMWMKFTAAGIDGSGMDDVGFFTWQGTYQLESMTCSIMKFYSSHQVDYRGHIDENGIWGQWTLGPIQGGFHLWPKKQAAERQEDVAKEVIPFS